MHYIVFDLEWNQSCSQKTENEMLPFEIIEIGAVKLDKKFNMVDEYSSIVRPQVYRILQNNVRNMLPYDEDYLRTGRTFDKVCKEFLDWCEKETEEYVFCTWGPSDLSILQKNMDFYSMPSLKTPLYFYNLQEIFSKTYKDLGVCRLERAVEFLNIPMKEPFHSALSDAKYTGKIMNTMHIQNLEDAYTVDYYNNPKTKSEEIINYHKGYSQYITREFSSKLEALQDKEILAVRCMKCKRKISKKIKWFSSNQNTYLCVGKCIYHGNMGGKIKFKTTFDDKIFIIKTFEPINKEQVEAIKKRQETIRLKRKEKSNQQKNHL